MLLVTEVYGIYALATLAWFSWSQPPRRRPAATPGRAVDVYVCTYDEPAEVVLATLAGCRRSPIPTPPTCSTTRGARRWRSSPSSPAPNT